MRAFGIVDAAIILATVCGTVAASGLLTSGRPDRVVVFRQNSVVAEYPLAGDIDFSVNGKNGPVDIEIKNGAARIIHANCHRSICKLSGGIRGPHAQLICAPNNILIQIQSSAGNYGVDGVTY